LPNATDVGLDSQLLVRPRGTGEPDPGLHLVQNEQRVDSRTALHRAQELGAEVVVPPSPWIGSAMKQAMFVRVRRNAARAAASASRSRLPRSHGR